MKPRRIVLVDTGEVLQEFEAKIGQPEREILVGWAKQHPGRTVAAEWKKVCPFRQSTEWVRWMTACEEPTRANTDTP